MTTCCRRAAYKSFQSFTVAGSKNACVDFVISLQYFYSGPTRRRGKVAATTNRIAHIFTQPEEEEATDTASWPKVEQNSSSGRVDGVGAFFGVE